ncbi:MAG: hypothetical protein ABW032_03665, partial [Burkholderiaceae bacterium]
GTSEISHEWRDRINELAKNAKTPSYALNPANVAISIFDIERSVMLQLTSIYFKLFGRAPLTDRLRTLHQSRSKLKQDSIQIDEVLAFIEGFPAKAIDREAQIALRDRALETKKMVHLCLGLMDDYLANMHAAKLKEVIEIGSSKPTVPASDAETQAGTAATAPVGKPRRGVATPRPEAGEPAKTPPSASTSPAHRPVPEATAIEVIDPARLKGTAYRRSLIFDMLSKLPALAHTEVRLGTRDLKPFAGPQRERMNEARSLKNGYRLEILSTSRLARAAEESSKLTEAAHASLAMVTAWNRTDNLRFPGASKSECLRDAIYCLGRAAALEALLDERSAVLQIPSQDMVMEARSSATDPARVSIIQAVKTYEGVMLRVKLFNPPAKGRAWLERKNVDASALDLPTEGAKPHSGDVEPDYWAIHIHLKQEEIVDPTEVTIEWLRSAWGRIIDFASAKPGTFEDPYKAKSALGENAPIDFMNVARGFRSERSLEGFDPAYIVQTVQDNLEKFVPFNHFHL